MLKQNTIAFIIPIHPPKFEFIYNLTKKLNIINKCCDIVLVFSNENEYNKFIYKDQFKNIILPPNYQNPMYIITFKKFYALNILKQNYSYYIVCDSEIDIIDENFTYENILMKINQFYNSKKIFSGEVRPAIRKITQACCNIFKSTDDKNKLHKLTRTNNIDYNLHYWWSDLPVYKGSHLEDFFSKINYDMNFKCTNFDHIIYLNYLVLYHNFEFINITPIIGIEWSLEWYGRFFKTKDKNKNINNLDILKKHSYTFSWIIPALFNKHKEYLMKNGSFLLYHVDRFPVSQPEP